VFNVWKPWFVYRPTQILRRVGYALHPPGNGTVVCLPWGCEIKLDARKTIGRSIAQTGIYDLALSELLWRLIQPGEQVLDIGANVGYTTALMGSRVGTRGKVLAFEPHPLLFRQLVENVGRFRKRYDFGNIELYENAVSNRAGNVTLVCPAEFMSNDGVAQVADWVVASGDEIQVQAIILDELLNDRGCFTVAKIDVEGHELQVLQGGATTFQDRVTHVVFEEHRGPGSPVCQLLESMGFRLLQFGWSLRSLLISDPIGSKLARSYEAPNFIATRKPDEVCERCRERGWHVLQQR
jgi:FkbM family methyltransferase